MLSLARALTPASPLRFIKLSKDYRRLMELIEKSEPELGTKSPRDLGRCVELFLNNSETPWSGGGGAIHFGSTKDMGLVIAPMLRRCWVSDCRLVVSSNMLFFVQPLS